MWRWPVMHPVALPGDQPVFLPERDDGAGATAPQGAPEARPSRPLRRLAGAAAVGALGGAMFGAVLIIAASRSVEGPATIELPPLNENVRYAYHAPPAIPSGGVQGVSMLVMPLAGDRGRHLSLVVTPHRERSGEETDLTFEVRLVDADGAPIAGATVGAELLALPWMDREKRSVTTGADGRAEFVFPDLVRAGSYELRIVGVSHEDERFAPPPGQDAISVPVPGAD